MKIILERCCRCGKGFDFEMYNGLCPNCGCFHRAKGVTTNNTMADKYVSRAEGGTLEADYERHIEKDRAKGISHENGHKTTANPDSYGRYVNNSADKANRGNRGNNANNANRSNKVQGNEKQDKKHNVFGWIIMAIIIITVLGDFLGEIISFLLGLL